MKSTFVVLLFTLVCGIQGFNQSLKLTNLIKYLNTDTDQIAEELLQQGFNFFGNQDYPSFQLGSGNENFSIELNRNGENYLSICASAKFLHIYNLIEKEIKTTSKKSKFFYSPWAQGYVTEYLSGNKYLYIGQGKVFLTKDNTPMKYIYISQSNLKSKLFNYE